ncbi:branched-chain amino acid ABC transporter permease [Nonomuraea harbinensis]|uniref:Branched-chain amino acid ABC transporter permease n=1 Tax=Nonomuraea harbinensis TaxID=1286938 RepID=A0ABW1C1C1_9ACTN|nr:branched-chain amino acid ABC transporter permease [Nonomuraea harbinensis]
MPLRIERGSRRHRLLRLALAGGAAVLLLGLPHLLGTVSQVDTLSQIAAYSVAILGLIILMGYCGQISLAHSAFIGLGGYTTVILVADHDWPYLATIPVSIVICLAVGALIGIPALRIRGLYLAAVTLAVAALFPALVIRFEELTGGTSGKFAREAMQAPEWFFVNPYTRVGPSIVRFYVIAAVAVLVFLVARSILRSRIGRSMVALREAPLSAAASGVQVARVKIFAFAISGAFGGVAGSLLAIQLPQASDTRYTLDLSIFLLVALVAGGSGTMLGAIPGAIIFVTLRTFVSDWAAALPGFQGSDGGQIVGIISCLLLLAIVFLMPTGVAGGLQKAGRRLVQFTDPVPAGWRRFQLSASSQPTPSADAGGSQTASSPQPENSGAPTKG